MEDDTPDVTPAIGLDGAGCSLDEEAAPGGDLKHLGVPVEDGKLSGESGEYWIYLTDLRQACLVSPDLPLGAPHHLSSKAPREHLSPATDPEGGLPALHDLSEEAPLPP